MDPRIARLEAATEYVRAQVRASGSAEPRASAPQVGIVLGSGLGRLVDAVADRTVVPYRDIPHFPPATVAGHAGEIVLGALSGASVAVLSGRVHLYEGYAPEQVVFPVRVLAGLGVTTVIVTNASGAVHPDYDPRDVMIITDHLNLTGHNPLVGPNLEAWGPRFPDMSAAYDPELRAIAHAAARTVGFEVRQGVYAGVLGPSYETPAEVAMLRTMGADAVGMSTVHEVIALRHRGVRVLGLSCITNRAAGLSAEPLRHEDVKLVAQQLQARLTALISETVKQI